MTKTLLAGALAAVMTAGAPAAFAATKSCPTVSPAAVEQQFTAFNAA
jgi:ABC-type proline/glycine betaine transport system substrate-binding protein